MFVKVEVCDCVRGGYFYLILFDTWRMMGYGE